LNGSIAPDAQLLDDLHDLELDLAEDHFVGDRDLEERGAAGDVMDDVHHLQHDARELLVRAVARRHEEQVARGELFGDVVAEREVERTAEIVDRVGAQLFEPADLFVGFGIELVEPQEPVDLAVVLERETVPIDHRIAT